MQKGGTVYLLVEDGDNELYKIGVTRGSVDNRIKKLQTGNGNKIRCVSSFESIAPYKLEKVLHDYYKADREEGEWFLLSKEQVNNFLSVCELYERGFKSMTENPFF
jgi:hypothetical protein